MADHKNHMDKIRLGQSYSYGSQDSPAFYAVLSCYVTNFAGFLYFGLTACFLNLT